MVYGFFKHLGGPVALGENFSTPALNAYQRRMAEISGPRVRAAVRFPETRAEKPGAHVRAAVEIAPSGRVVAVRVLEGREHVAIVAALSRTLLGTRFPPVPKAVLEEWHRHKPTVANVTTEIEVADGAAASMTR